MQGMYETLGIAQMVEREWKKWLLHTQAGAYEKQRPKALIPTVTISREKGSGGGTIGRQVAEKLGFALFDKEIVDYVSRSASLDRLVVEHLDEHSQQNIRQWTQQIMQQKRFLPQTYMAHLTKAISTIGEKGGAVIVGRGAHLILPADRCVRVRIVAPAEMRIARVCGTAGLSHEEGRRLVAQTDQERSRFIQETFGLAESNPLDYDLTINTGYLTLDSAATLIVHAVLERFPVVMESPLPVSNYQSC